MYISDSSLEAKIIEILTNSADENGCHTIKGKSFTLKIFGKTVCPRGFCQIYGISINTLNKLAEEQFINVTDDKHEVLLNLFVYFSVPGFQSRYFKKRKNLCFPKIY